MVTGDARMRKMGEVHRQTGRTEGSPAVATARVQGHVKRARATAGIGAADLLALDLDDVLPDDAARAIRRLRVPAAIIIAIGILTELVPLAPWPLIIPAVLGVALLRLDRRIRFGFAEGLIGYRRDVGWPRGVQEEDDVDWRWPPVAGAETLAAHEDEVDVIGLQRARPS